MWISYADYISYLYLICTALATDAQITDVKLSSTEHSVTLTFSPNIAATNYTASFRLSQGIFWKDYGLEGPYSGSPLQVTHTSLLPGSRYTVEVFENLTRVSHKVYQEEIATVPLTPESVTASVTGSNFIVLQWVSPQNLKYESHEIHFMCSNSSWQEQNATWETKFNLTGLDSGYSYQVFVVAVTAGVRSQRSEIAEAFTLPAPPVNLTAMALGTNQIRITWMPESSSFQESFQVRYSLEDVNSLTNTTCSHSPCTLTPGPPSGQTVDVFVYSLSHGYLSSPATIKGSTAPGIVANLIGISGVGSLNLSWSAPAHSVQVSYRLTVASITKNNSQTNSILATSPEVSYALNSLIGGYVYKVEVRAVARYAIGEARTDLFVTVPESIFNLTGQAINTTSIKLTWQNPRKSIITFLNITIIKPDGDSLYIREEDTHAETQTVSNLVSGEKYQVIVTVHSQYALATPSEEMMIYVRTKPVKPHIVSVSAGERRLNVTVERAEEGGVFDSIQASLHGVAENKLSDVSGVVTFSDLNPGTQYSFEAVSYSGQETSEYVYRNVYTKPRPPSDLVVMATGERTINARWSGPDFGGYDNFTIFLLAVDSISYLQTYVVNNTKVELKGLQPGSTYNLSVASNKGDQTSSKIWQQNTTIPLPVAHIRVLARDVTMVTVAWDAPIGSAYSGYALTFDFSNMTMVPLPSNVTQYRLTGLAPESNYTLKLYVYSQRMDGIRHYSQETNFSFYTYPESVAGLQKIMATASTIMVNWTTPTSIRADFFNVGIKSLDSTLQPKELSQNLHVSRTNATFRDLMPGQEYMIAIRTVRSTSPTQPPQYGPSVRIRAVTKPLAVENLQVTAISTSILTVKWNTNVTSTQDSFLVVYTASDLTKSMSLQVSNTSSYQVNLTKLFAGYEYKIKVTAMRSTQTDAEESAGQMHVGHTAPLPVSNLTLNTESSDLRVTWTPPTNGRWSGFQIRYRPMFRIQSAVFLVLKTAQSNTSILITDLIPGEGYQVKIAVLSNDLESSEVEAFAVLRPLPPKDLHQFKNKTTTTSVSIGWTYDQATTYTSKWSFQVSGSTIGQEVMATNKTEYALVLSDLVPGQTYDVVVTSVVNSTKSQIQGLHVTTKPVINSRLEPSSSTNSSIMISYTISAVDIYDHLVFSLLDDAEAESVNRTKVDQPLTVSFSGLQSGRKYTVQAVTVSRGEVSSPIMLEMVTDPNPVPVDLTSNSTSVTLTLGLHQGHAAQYILTCRIPGMNGTLCGQQTVIAKQQEVTFENLTPFQVYKFTVVTESVTVRQEAKQAVMEYEVKTAEAPPAAVMSLNAESEDLHSAILTWQAPDMVNGILRSYAVSVHGIEPSDPQTQDLQALRYINASTTSIRFDDLNAGYEYIFKVAAVTIAQGEVAETKITMPTAAPLFKSGMTAATSKPKTPDPSEQIVTDSKIAYVFTSPFTSENGFVRYHTVVVSMDKTADDKGATLPSWADARRDSNIKVYQALEQCPDFFIPDSSCGGNGGSRRTRSADALESRIFIIGAQTADECEGQQFCNGPLSGNTEYYVKLRGYTASGLYEETEYSEKIRTAEVTTTNFIGIIGGVVGAVLCVIAVLAATIVIFVCRKRQHSKNATKYTGPRTVLDHSAMINFSRPVKISDFPYHVLKMTADSDFRYAEEYEDLKQVGRDQLCLAAELPQNRAKNRFTNILPYDHSRVKLLPVNGEDGCDYINASYMPGYKSAAEYVATQGPLAATRDDFWKMIWEQDSHNIVMLTRCHEKGREKSDRYWPNDSEPKVYGDLQVMTLSETRMPDWTVTDFSVSLGQNSRIVRHFHYKVWPDFGVPKNPTSLIRFVRTVRESLVKGSGPIIVHCSAGVGRSGTFIALDHLFQLIREKDEVDIFGLVYSLRKGRVLMVQTEQQYKFIHECLLYVLEGREDERIYANLAQVNAGFHDSEGINTEVT